MTTTVISDSNQINPEAPTLEVAAAPTVKAEVERVNLMLDSETLSWLDQESKRVNTEHAGQLNRSVIIRGLIGGFRKANGNLGTCGNEYALKNAVARWLRTAAAAQHAAAKPQAERSGKR
jgi:hypothetical protein